MLITLAARLFAREPMTRRFREMRHALVEDLIGNKAPLRGTRFQLYRDLINTLCRIRIGNLRPRPEDERYIKALERFLRRKTDDNENRIAMVAALYF